MLEHRSSYYEEVLVIGSVCCDGTLQYEMNRVVDETLRNHPEQDQTSIARVGNAFAWASAFHRRMATYRSTQERNHRLDSSISPFQAVQRSVQRRFGTTFESIASKGDFVWQTNIFNENTCKIDAHGYHLLTVESSKLVSAVQEHFESLLSTTKNAFTAYTLYSCSRIFFRIL